MKKQTKIIISFLCFCVLTGISVFAYMRFSEDYEGQKICEVTINENYVRDVKASCACLHNILEDEGMSMKKFIQFNENESIQDKESFELSKEEKKFIKIVKRSEGCRKKIGKNEQKTIEEVSHLIPNISLFGAGKENYEFLNSNEILLSSGIVPDSLVSGNKLINRYGGEVILIGKGKEFSIVYKDIPETVCKIILDEDWGKKDVLFVFGCDDCKKSKCSITWSTQNPQNTTNNVQEDTNIPNLNQSLAIPNSVSHSDSAISIEQNNVNNLIDADWWKTATFEDVKREIDKGANVNAKGNDKTKSGDLRTNVTPLMFAIKYGNSNPEIIKFLIDSGADVNAKEGEIGLTVLMYAAQFSENPKIINILISAGANVEARRYNGATTLMAAAIFNNNPQIIETLIKNKADIFATDNAGNKAIDYAKKYNNFNAIQILEKVMNEALTSKQDLTTLDSTTGNSITSFQQDISNLRQTFENIESLLKAGRYTDEITNIPNLAPSIQNSSGGKVSYQASETGGYEISYHDVSFDLCVYLVSYNYDFLDKYNGFKYMTTSEGEYTDEQWFDAKTMLPLSEEQAYKVCKTCGSKCTISWKLGLSGGEVEEFNEEQHSDNQTDEVIWNDGAPQNINQAYENASYSDQVSFAATFAGCIEEQKFNQAYMDSLPIDMRFQMAFSGGSNVSRQCKCIFQAARKYLGDAEYNKAQQLRQQGRNGSADKILEQAIPAAFGECF